MLVEHYVMLCSLIDTRFSEVYAASVFGVEMQATDTVETSVSPNCMMSQWSSVISEALSNCL